MLPLDKIPLFLVKVFIVLSCVVFWIDLIARIAKSLRKPKDK